MLLRFSDRCNRVIEILLIKRRKENSTEVAQRCFYGGRTARTQRTPPPFPLLAPEKRPYPPPRGEIFAPREKFFALNTSPLRSPGGKFSPRGLAVRRGRATFAFAFGTGRGGRKRGGPGGAAFVGAWRCEGPAGPGPGGPGAAGAEEHKRESIISKGEFDPGSG